MKVRDAKNLTREPVYSRPMAFNTIKNSFIPPETMQKLWKSTKLHKAHVEEHPFYGKFKVKDSCWHWTGPGGSDGLGRTHDRLVSWFAWYAANGPMPDWARLENTCGNPLCHNPCHSALVPDAHNEKFLQDNPEFSDKNYPLPWNKSGKILVSVDAPEEVVEVKAIEVKAIEVKAIEVKAIPTFKGSEKPAQPVRLQIARTPVLTLTKKETKPLKVKALPKLTPVAQAVEAAGLCRNGHDTAVTGWYIFGGGKRRECRACKIARHRKETAADQAGRGLVSAPAA